MPQTGQTKLASRSSAKAAALLSKPSKLPRCSVSGYTMDLALRIFDELGLAAKDGNRFIIPPPPRQKLDLMDSDTFRRGMKGKNT